MQRQPQTSENWAVGGYYTACPVPTHKTDDLISVWAGKDGGLGLKCWGNCTYSDINKALANVIKTSVPPVTEPQATAKARSKELEEALAIAETRVRTLQAEKSDLADQLAATEEGAEHENQKRIASETRVRELEREKSYLEKTLTSTEEERKRESAARIAAQNEVRRIQAEKTRAESDLADAEAPKAELENRLSTVEEELERERTDRIAAEDRLSAAEEEREREHTARTNLEKQLAAAEDQARQEAQKYAALEKRFQETAKNNRERVGLAPNTPQSGGAPLDRVRRLFYKAANSSPEQRLIAAEGQARLEAQKRADVEKQLTAANDAHEREREVLQNRAQELEAELSSRQNNLTTTEEEREREHTARVDAQNRVRKLEREKSHLEKDLTAIRDFRKQETAACIAAEKHAQKLQAENSSLEKNLASAESERDQERAARVALEKQLAAASNVRQGVREPNTLQMNGPLSNAWRLFSKKEPTYAFIDAMSVLEFNLRFNLEKEMMLDDDGLRYMLMSANDRKLISREEWGD